MRNIIESNIYRLLKNKTYYGICILLSLYTISIIAINFIFPCSDKIPFTGIENLRSWLCGPYIIVILFMILTGKFILEDYNSGAIKNILGRGISRYKYFFGKIISVYIVSIITWIIFVIIQVVISSIESGIGIGNIRILLIGIILNILFILALIIIITGVIAISRNVGVVIVTTVIAINISKIIMFIFSLFNINLNLSWMNMVTYINGIAMTNMTNRMFIIGILIMIIYMIVFLAIGSYAMKKQDVR